VAVESVVLATNEGSRTTDQRLGVSPEIKHFENPARYLFATTAKARMFSQIFFHLLRLSNMRTYYVESEIYRSRRQTCREGCH
jgi:hypothetical protein